MKEVDNHLQIKMRTFLILIGVLSFFLACNNNQETHKNNYGGWENYAGNKDGSRYSSLNQINKKNVKNLKIAWRYSTGDKDKNNRSQNQCNPIIVNGIFYGTSPKSKLIALKASTGEPLWTFDPVVHDTVNNENAYYKVIRGVTYWANKAGNEAYIFYGVGSKMFCIDALSGNRIESFGEGGYIDLTKDLGRDPYNFNPFVASTSPPIVYENLLILSTRVAETADAAPGHIRAYDTRSGELKWVFHTIPHPGEIGYDSWPDKESWKKLGGANNWAGMSLDQKRGIVFVPTGSVSGDFYGGIRKGENRFANSLIALEALTGDYLWHYQIVHHDLWDRDLPANPNLVTLYKDKDTIDAVAQITKHGYVFIFDRENGQPIFPIEEVAVPQHALPGEEPWPTQPIPTLPEPFARQKFTIDEVTNLDSITHIDMLAKFKKIKYSEKFTPPSKEGAWIFPGFDGGGQWGGAAVDPETQILYVNSSEVPWSLTMIDIPKTTHENRTFKGIGKQVYNQNCLTCHGADLKGNGTAFPSLLNVGDRYDKSDILTIIEKGKNMMPAFGQLSETEKSALLTFIMDLEEKESANIAKNGSDSIQKKTNKTNRILSTVPYTMTGYNRFLDRNGYPGITPPWGTLNAVHLSSGKLLWKVPLGEYKELTERGISPTGTENYGGPVVTKGGLIFIAATNDSKIRAFDKDNGKILWEADLPVPGFATPAIYEVDNKQFVVVACGGGKIGADSGDEYIAFSLPTN